MVNLDRERLNLENDVNILVEQDYIGKRLDVFLAESTGLTRANIQRLIKAEKIFVNNHVCKANYNLKLADKITLLAIKPVLTDILPEDIPLDIIYQDESLAIINKAKGMVLFAIIL